ncbi:MAG TPA: hypothetical protein VM433_05565 [Mycobacteriales bacterium]|nr:hypothetical protein [Mycobacteriales bacterium]
MAAVEVDPEALQAIVRALAEVAAALEADVPPLREASASARSGAGELSGDLAPGLEAFRLSWEAVLRVTAGSAELAADSITSAAETYRAVDEQAVRPGGPR